MCSKNLTILPLLTLSLGGCHDTCKILLLTGVSQCPGLSVHWPPACWTSCCSTIYFLQEPILCVKLETAQAAVWMGGCPLTAYGRPPPGPAFLPFLSPQQTCRGGPGHEGTGLGRAPVLSAHFPQRSVVALKPHCPRALGHSGVNMTLLSRAFNGAT